MRTLGFLPADPAPARVAAPEPLLRDLVGEVLRGERLQQGRTLREVADLAGVSMAYLSEVERGRKEPSSEILAAVCRALGLSVLDLLARTYQRMVPFVDRTLVQTAPAVRRGPAATGSVLALTG